MRRRLHGAFAALLLIAAPAVSRADEPAEPGKTQVDEATRRFKRGLELYEEQDYTNALIELRRAYELAPSYKLLFNIGQICYQLTDYACSLRSFEQYLKDGGNAVSSERRAQVEKDIQRLQTRVGKLEIVTNVEGVDLTIDDVYVGKSPLNSPVVVSAGKRRITATKEGRVPITRIVEAAGTDSMRVELDLIDAATGAGSAPPPPSRPSLWTTWSWVGVGAAGVLGVAAGVTGVLALNASSDLDKIRFTGTSPSSEVTSKQSDVKVLSLTSDILLGAAGVTLVTTLILTYTRSPSTETTAPPKPAARVSIGWSPTGVSVMGGF
jgi:hypothetical protein